MNKLFQQALEVARTYSVSTPENSIVLYSISFQPTKENRDKAFDYTSKHSDKMVIEHTDCGAKLVEMGLLSHDSGLSQEQVAEIWSIASKRFIGEAKGEVPNILTNPNLTKINGMDKYEFASQFK